MLMQTALSQKKRLSRFLLLHALPASSHSALSLPQSQHTSMMHHQVGMAMGEDEETARQSFRQMCNEMDGVSSMTSRVNAADS